MKFFISDPAVQCLLSESKKLWQAHLLAGKQGKIVNASQLFTELLINEAAWMDLKRMMLSNRSHIND